MKKQDVLTMLQTMPDDLDVDELLYRIQLLQMLEEADREYREGRYISHEEFVRRSEEWLASSG